MPNPNDYSTLIPKQNSDQFINPSGGGTPGYGDITKTLGTLNNIPSMTETIMPAIKNLLGPSATNEYTGLIDQNTSQNVAQAQTDAMKRGLTGSDIEAGAMVGARGAGDLAKSQFYGQNANSMASMLKDMATGDLNNHRENIMALAQAMGQKLTSDTDIRMFQQQLQVAMDQASMNQETQLMGAGIGLVGKGITAAAH